MVKNKVEWSFHFLVIHSFVYRVIMSDTISFNAVSMGLAINNTLPGRKRGRIELQVVVLGGYIAGLHI